MKRRPLWERTTRKRKTSSKVRTSLGAATFRQMTLGQMTFGQNGRLMCWRCGGERMVGLGWFKWWIIYRIMIYRGMTNSIKVCSYYGKNCAKLMSFKEQKIYFAFLKLTNLARFSPWCKHGLIVEPGNTNWGGSLCTVDLLIKVACFVKNALNVSNLKRSLSEPVSTRRSTVMSFLPLQ